MTDARVVYLMNVSLDGYINDVAGSPNWASVDEELHGWFNEVERALSAEIYGRRLYETMAAYWPFAENDPGASVVELDFARAWNATPRIVFSRSLETAEHATRLLRTDVVDELPALTAEFDGDLGIGGATIAAPLIERNLVDVYRLVVHPVVLGGGTPYFPPGAALDLRLIETRRFGNGAVLVTYEPRR
ncbi:MAG: dihydrofolate reductase family protein [Chloroflexota bacterium]